LRRNNRRENKLKLRELNFYQKKRASCNQITISQIASNICSQLYYPLFVDLFTKLLIGFSSRLSKGKMEITLIN